LLSPGCGARPGPLSLYLKLSCLLCSRPPSEGKGGMGKTWCKEGRERHSCQMLGVRPASRTPCKAGGIALRLRREVAFLSYTARERGAGVNPVPLQLTRKHCPVMTFGVSALPG
jgi:hypothetical protein